MSVVKRVMSGSVAAWLSMLFGIISQILIIPIYLEYWSVEMYAMWITIQTIINTFTIIDKSHQSYIGYEFFKLKVTNYDEFLKCVSSGILVGFIFSLLQVVLLCVLYFSNSLTLLFSGIKHSNILSTDELFFILLLQAFSWCIFSNIGGILVRLLATFGYYSRMAWWGTISTTSTVLFPVYAVSRGGNLMSASITLILTTVFMSLPVYIDIFRILRKEKVNLVKPSFSLGWRNYKNSISLAAKDLLENFRQQGIRLIIGPMAGASGLTSFTTMRTGSNMALQGLNTIINPLMPELMRYLHQKDQSRSETAFNTIWIVVVTMMAPAVVLLQLVVDPLYHNWTRGKVPFDPALFSLLSLSVLVFAVMQPAVAVVNGNNLVKVQLLVAIFATAVVVGGTILLIPIIGILGVGIILLVVEVCIGIVYKKIAQNWLIEHGLRWPVRSFNTAILSVVIAAISMAAIVMLPQMKIYIGLIAIFFFCLNIRHYWRSLPDIAVENIIKIVNNLPVIRNIFSIKPV